MQHDITRLEPDAFPALLAEVPQPPTTLWVRGTLPSFDRPVLTVVGSRAATSYGRDVCRTLVKGLAGTDTLIVSGLALGVDAIAHEAALDAGLTTVAVPGSGLADAALYPRTNVGLARRIVDAGGALLSEYDPDQRAAPWTFPQRNRIMAGLARAVLIIEAEEKSGTLITARMALDYNRDVLAVPGAIGTPTARGTNMLIRQGATPITSPDDLREALGFERSEMNTERDISQLSPEEQRVIALLREPCTRDELIRTLKLSARDAIVLLSAMEIKGLLKEELGVVRIMV